MAGILSPPPDVISPGALALPAQATCTIRLRWQSGSSATNSRMRSAMVENDAP
jgi:hypothetical protein